MNTTASATEDPKPLSEEENLQLAALMRRATPRFHQAVFDAWEWAFGNWAVELAILNRAPEGWMIFLEPRPDSDKFYAGQEHMPGTVVLPDQTMESAMQALIVREVGGLFIGHPTFAQHFEFDRTERPRGRGICFLYQVKVSPAVASDITRLGKGKFWPINNLPEKTITHHRTMIEGLRELLGI